MTLFSVQNTKLQSMGKNSPLTWERWRGGYFDPTRMNFSAVGIFLGIITR